MVKNISLKELAELEASGAEILPDEESLKVEGWDALIQQLSRNAKANEKIADKRTEQLTEVLQNLTVACSKQQINMAPIAALLREVINMVQPEVHHHDKSYRFRIERDNRGITEVIATPIDVHLLN